MINKRYNKLFNNFEVLKQTDAKYRVSLDNIAQVKKELKDIKNIGKFTSKKSNVFFDDIKLNYNQIDTELNHLRDAVLTDQIFDNSEVQILSNKFNDIFDTSHSLNLIKNVLDKKNIITDILYLELHESQTSFSKIFKIELNNLLNEKKTIKGINNDLINFKNILDRYTEFDQKTFDEMKNKNGVDISVLLSNKKYIANILSAKQIDNVENYIKLIFTEINSFNEAFTDLFEKYQKHINSSAGQINKKIKENLENKTLKNEIILKDIETILKANKKAYEESLDKKEAEEETLRLEKEAEQERLRQEEKTRLVAIEKAKKTAELAQLEAQERKERQEKFYTFLGYLIVIVGSLLCLWGLWELSVYIWLSYAGIVVNTIGAALAIISAIVFFGASKLLGVIFFVVTAFIYIFLDDLVPITDIKTNNKTEIIKKLKVPSKNSLNSNQIKNCPSSGYKDNCKGRMSYSSGDTYNGFFKNNKRHGQGTYHHKNGDKYSGNWKNSKKHGRGTYTWKNGNKYVGQWQNSNMHGQGVKTFKNGKIQRGIWKNDKFIGSKTEKSLSKYQSKAKDTIKLNQTNECPSSGYKDNCKGRMSYGGGDTYIGFFKNNKRHGQGTYVYKNGTKLTGTFYKGLPSYGTETYGGKWKGDRYTGNFENWNRSGQGNYFWKNGNKYFGQWQKNKLHGQGTFTWKSGNKYVGQWEKGNQHGQGIKTYNNGKIEKGIWKNGNFLYVQESQNP
ncbi:hypothetical protein ABXT66_04655 [Candidatus Levibacter sp. Uisw_134_01]|uniref:hypothetical protein n=1 Tax=Candidatus Levibacter sp. Uisw_134_01 TaxID=3230999 RepID=UPI003D45E6F0